MKETFQRLRRRALVEIVGAAARPLQRPRPDDPYHAVFADFIARVNERDGPRILELGARGSQPIPASGATESTSASTFIRGRTSASSATSMNFRAS